jgi:hypothetical protein
MNNSIDKTLQDFVMGLSGASAEEAGTLISEIVLNKEFQNSLDINHKRPVRRVSPGA